MEKADLILDNLIIADFNPPAVRRGLQIAVKDGLILEVGKNLGNKYDAPVNNLEGKLVMPGLVVAHHHFYSALARGITARIKPSNSFVEILENLWWRLDRAIDEDILKYSGLVGAIEALRCGVTSVIDHHASPEYIDGSLDILADAFTETGLRGILAYEVTDRNGKEGMEAGVRENIRFAEKQKNSGILRGAIGAHAPFTLGEEAMEKLADAVESTGSGIHIHVSEDEYDESYSLSQYYERPLERLGKMLNKKAIIAHGVHLSELELKLLNKHDIFLVHNSRSNMNNNVGYFNALPRVKNVALGTDGIGSDMLSEMQSAFYKNRDAGGPLWPNDYLGFLDNGNRILERYFGGTFGKIVAGGKADLSFWKYESPVPLSGENLAGHLVFGMHQGFADGVMVNGKIIMEKGEFPFDVRLIYEKAAEQAQRLWDRMDALPD
jgi:putative selenium metabolism protein SsnA